jgi:threonine synthase
MDIQVSSNFERLLFEASGRDAAAVREHMGNLAKSGGLERVGAVLRRERALDEVLGRFVEESGP